MFTRAKDISKFIFQAVSKMARSKEIEKRSIVLIVVATEDGGLSITGNATDNVSCLKEFIHHIESGNFTTIKHGPLD